MASAGTYISGIGHAGLVVWLVAGWGFDADPLPFEISEVSVVSGEEFAALIAASTPDPGDAAPQAPVQPETGEAPEAPAPEQAPSVPLAPPETAAPDTEQPPPEAPTPPAPVQDVADVAPVLPQPQEVQAPIPEPVTDAAPAPRPVPRVAPEPAPPQTPQIDTQPEPVPDSTPVSDPEAPDVPVEPPAATQEAVTEIARPDETPSGAVEVSARPQARPSRPQPAPEAPQTADIIDQEVVDEAVRAALEAAGGVTSAPDVPQGPPMTGSEKDSFRLAVNACWNVDPGSEAARATVVVAFDLGQDGRVVGDVRLVSATGGSDGAQSIAFQAARRAILRCQSSGYRLPPEKYGQWKEVEITFDPSGMRLR